MQKIAKDSTQDPGVSLRSQFPIFSYHPTLIYLDSAATTHKLQCVIDAISEFSSQEYATVHRALYDLSEKATEKISSIREKIGRFLGAASPEEVIFTKGATEAINLVRSCLQERFSKDCEILITEGEHHANIVPWQLLAKQTGATVKVAPLLEDGTLDVEQFLSLLSPRARLVCFAHVFNTTGNINPVSLLTKKAQECGALVLIDGAQAASHMPIDVQAIGADFYTFSFHKMYGPTGLGVLYGKKDVLETMPPYQVGGDMIDRVRFTGTTWKKPPLRFEAGTPAICQIVGAGAAIDFLEGYGMERIHQEEQELRGYFDAQMQTISSLRLLGSQNRIGTVCFTSHLHPMDLGMLLDARNIAIRTGRHCADPFHDRFSLGASCRASLGIYTTRQDIQMFVRALRSFLHDA